ncbi:hypothetical protein [Sphingobium sp. B2D3C]|uniref:hypothetical protein n=1 Tax=Sphingobium sp. B2D3C TaxID=2940581 RepID=UPI002224DF76|nr:hypothetical protein [Sphingobium sp. B2D3C]MCW2397952.1 hypothetical protein [Sphingobium sp. B2D3C]
MTLVITTCTNRKRKPIPDSLHVSALPQAPIADVASDWVARLSAAADVFPARDIYGGRSFQEAQLAAHLLDARVLIVSAGLGLVWADIRVPPYACTVLVDAADSIASRVTGDYSVAGWWQALSGASPFSQSLAGVVAETEGLICAALSDAYIEMIVSDLCALPVEALERLRLFTRAPMDRVAPNLRRYIMPYDDRLDGPDSPVRGTRGDFAGRALHHFAEYIIREGDNRSAAEHGAAVSAALGGWRMAARFDRRRLENSEVLALIRDHWDAERGSTARLLRRLRDDLGVACEQGRFADLARQVRAERA